jgi:hypothetical protein
VVRLTGPQWAVSVVVGLISLPVGLVARLIPNDVFFFWLRCMPESRKPRQEFRILEPLTPLSGLDAEMETRRLSMSSAAPSGRVSPAVSRRSDEGSAANLSFFRNLRGGRVYGAEAQSITSFHSNNTESKTKEFYTTPAVRRWNVVQNAVQDGTLRRKILDQANHAKITASKRASISVPRVSEDNEPMGPSAISLSIHDTDMGSPGTPEMAQVVLDAVAARDAALQGAVVVPMNGTPLNDHALPVAAPAFVSLEVLAAAEAAEHAGASAIAAPAPAVLPAPTNEWATLI